MITSLLFWGELLYTTKLKAGQTKYQELNESYCSGLRLFDPVVSLCAVFL